MRIIPKNTRVAMELFKGIGVADVLVGLVGVAIAVAIFMSNIQNSVYIMLGVSVLWTVLLVNIDSDRVYMMFLGLFEHLALEKSFLKDVPKTKAQKKASKIKAADIRKITAATGIKDGAIEYGGKYYGMAIEIPPVEFRFYSLRKQNQSIDRVFAAVLRLVSGDQCANLVKIDRPLNLDNFIAQENIKMRDIKEAYANGLVSETELTQRMEILCDRREEIARLNFADRVIKGFHYLVLFDSNKQLLKEQIAYANNLFNEGEINTHVLDEEELAVFLKYNYTTNFDEREIHGIAPEDYMDWILPDSLNIYGRAVEYEHSKVHTLRIMDYPTMVSNAWGSRLFDMPGTKVIMKLKPVEKYRAIQRIDRALDELRGQESQTGKASKLIELDNHIGTLTDVLSLLQRGNETLFEVNVYVNVYEEKIEIPKIVKTKKSAKDNAKAKKAKGKKAKGKAADVEAETAGAEEEQIHFDPSAFEAPPEHQEPSLATVNFLDKISPKKRIRRLMQEDAFRTEDLLIKQSRAYIASQVSAYDPFLNKSRAIHSTSVAACFPFVHSMIQDSGGVNFGYSGGYPVFLNFFRRDGERVNSNTVIMGKSGSGKSFATKTILTNLAAEDSKVFILDPENEYANLCKNLNGKLIDAGSSKQGRLNPFHIVPSVDEDEGEGDSGNSFLAHLQFLEEFFRQILPNLTSDALEQLNNIIIRTYEIKGIDEESDLTALSPEDFPTFDDLYDKILSDYQTVKSEYSRLNLTTLINYISKFSTGGRNSNLWNGSSTITTNENFVVFNFQSLLANKNNTIANAQMLLILKWLDNEIIKNRDYNMKYNASRKIIVVIDEAHVFIDAKFPVALDFMFQLAKRIRKYNGMQIIITQNIKDFVGTEEIARKSTAIINACQYSFIFPLSPNDMHDLCKLYEKAGEINEDEQEQIINNPRGNAFVVTGPASRSCMEIVANDGLVKLFS